MRDIHLYTHLIETDIDQLSNKKVNFSALTAKFYGTTFWHYYAKDKYMNYIEYDILSHL